MEASIRPTPTALQAVVHDLKNALGSLENELERLVIGEGLAAVGPAHAQCSQLRLRLLGFLLMTASGEAMSAQVEPHDPADFLREVRAGFVVPSGGPTLDCILGAGCPPVVFFDGRLVNLALHAALSNALRFARTRIVLQADWQAGDLVLSCEDDGPGWASGPTPGGSGLGTAICVAVAHAHQRAGRRGELQFDRSALGGARWALRLP